MGVTRITTVRLVLDDDYSARTEKPILATDRLDEKLDGLQHQASEADRQLSGLGRTEAKVAAESGLLSIQVERTREKLNGLIRDLDHTGDLGLLKDIRKARTELRQLEQAARGFGPKSRPPEPGPEPENPLLHSTRAFGVLFNQLRSAAVPILIGALIALSPLIGAALNAAALGALGSGGIALGIVGQIKDPRVHAALVSFANDLKTQLTADTGAMAQPLVASLGILKDAIGQILRTIDFSALSETLVPLSRGIAGLVDKMGPGLHEAIQASVPLLQELATLLPTVGEALSKMFHLLSQNPEGAKQGLRTIILLINGLVVSAGALIYVLTTVYSWVIAMIDGFNRLPAAAKLFISIITPMAALALLLKDAAHDIRVGSQATDQLGRSLKGTGDQATLTSDQIAELTSEIGKLDETQDRAAGKMTDFLINSMLNAERVANQFQRSLTQLAETLKDNGNAIDKHTGFVARNTKEGEANRDAVLSVIEANLRVYDTNIAVGMSAEDAARKWDEGTKALRDQLHAAHFTDAQINELIGSYENVPHRVNTIIAVQGLSEAIKNLEETLRLINNLPPRRDVDIFTHKYLVEQHVFLPPSNSIGGSAGSNPSKPRALGGSIEANQMYLVGERGEPELFVSRAGGMMYPNIQRYAGYRSSGAVGGNIDNRTITYVINNALDPGKVVAAIKAYEQSNSANWRK